MSVPVSPFTTSDMVALFQRNLIDGQTDFSPLTVLPDSTIDKFILLVSGSVSMKFLAAGYVLPFQVLDGETWPDHQTQFLELITCLGVCSLISPALKPAPGLGPGRTGSAGNIFKELYDEQLKLIYDGIRTTLRFRAKYYRDTAAERSLLDPRGPTSDFLIGQVDPNRQAFFTDYIGVLERVRQTYAPDSSTLKWDWFYDKFGLGVGSV